MGVPGQVSCASLCGSIQCLSGSKSSVMQPFLQASHRQSRRDPGNEPVARANGTRTAPEPRPGRGGGCADHQRSRSSKPLSDAPSHGLDLSPPHSPRDTYPKRLAPCQDCPCGKLDNPIISVNPLPALRLRIFCGFLFPRSNEPWNSLSSPHPESLALASSPSIRCPIP